MVTNRQIAFNPQGETVVVVAAAVAPLGVVVDPGPHVRIINNSTYTVFLGIGNTAIEAQNNAVIPTEGNPTSALPIVAGTVEILKFSTNSALYLSGISTNNAILYVTPGDGI